MNVFHCQCGYIFVIDLEAAKVIGPIYGDQGDAIYIGNQRKEITIAAFRDFYGDCWANLTRSIPSKIPKPS